MGADFLQRLRLPADHFLSQGQILGRRAARAATILFPAQQDVAGQVFGHVIAARQGLNRLVVAEGQALG